FRVGLTGGIACGKTTVANFFAALGVPIIDTDLLAREVVALGSALLPRIAEHFGPEILAADGGIDRRMLRERVFADAAERGWLEELTHPAIRALTDERSAAARGPYSIVAIPLLVETQGAERFSRVLVVDCEPESQIARVQARDGITRDAAMRMLAAQVSRATRLAAAHDIIRNDGDLAALRDQVEKLHRTYLAAAAAQAEQETT
ncbi:MAG: dephospho-CoA kinase, partial [Steroidobacteraceae bacterium]|nr:dephospho-CoA kinase [Steroidobacteraceae bacterium]